MKQLKIFFSWNVLLLNICTLSAQEYAIRHFGEENGLSGSYVNMAIEGFEGYKWIGTDAGLSRFDGLSFEIIEKNDSTQTKFPTASLAAKDSSIWIGYHNGELRRLNGEKIEIHSDEEGYNPIVSITEDDTGVIWALTQNNGIISVKDGQFYRYNTAKLAYKKANVILKYEGSILVGTNEGLLIYKLVENELIYQGEIEALSSLAVHSMIKTNQHDILMAGVDDRGLYQIDISNHSIKPIEEEILNGKSIVTIVRTVGDNLWLGTKYSGLIKVNFNRGSVKPIQFTYMNINNGFPSNQISSLNLDQGNLWVGTVGSGLVQVYKKGVVFYDFKDFHVKSVNCISGNKQYEYLFGTDIGMIKGYYKNHVDSLQIELIHHEEITGEEVTTIYTNDDVVYFGLAKKGLFKSDMNFDNVTTIPFKYSGDRIRHITQDGQGDIWLSVMYKGVFVIDTLGNIKKNYAINTGFYHNEIYDIHIDQGGNKWFASHSAGLAVMKPNGEINYLTKEGVFPSRDVNDISEDENGNVWIATYGNGVYEFDGKEFIRFDSDVGLLNNYCNTVISDRNNHIWTGHRLGLSRIDENTNAVSKVVEKDGLYALEFIPRSVYSDENHNIWMGNRNGVTFLNTPYEMFEPKVLETLITDVKVDFKLVDLYKYSDTEGEKTKVPRDMVFPYDHNNLTFEFVAINLKKPQSNLYQFKLEGYNVEWSPGTRTNEMSYSNLNAGKYVFMVRQSDNPDHWGDNITKLSFTIAPAWWNTWVARIIFFFIGMACLGALLRYRMMIQIKKQIKKRRYFEITENQNTRLKNFAFITSHNTKSYVVNLMGLVSLLERDKNNEEYFSLVKNTLDKLNLTIGNIGELLNFENDIETVKQKECNLKSIIGRVITLNHQLIYTNQADIKINIPEGIILYAVPAYIESVFSNLITNAIRYGVTDENKKVLISATQVDHQVVVTVEDHGLGIDMKAHQGKLFELGSRFHSSKSDGQGFGLFMSKHQLSTMGGKIDIDSEVGKGTTVIVTFNNFKLG